MTLKEEQDRRFLREVNWLATSSDPETATAMAAGERAGLDAREVALSMERAIGGRWVREQRGTTDLWDPYTEWPLEVTEEGVRFLRS